MQHLVGMNADDSRRATDSYESTNRNKAARNVQWQISTVTESFKQHGHIYLAIVNLAAHLSHHPIAKTLMNIDPRAIPSTLKSKTKNTSKKDEMERVPSVEQIHQPVQSYRERWRTLAAAAMSDGRGRGGGGGTNVSLSSDIGKATDSVSIEVQQKLGSLSNGDDPTGTTMGHKQTIVNKVAANKLSFIEQILYDLTLIKDEIEFQTDPIHYNEPGHSFAWERCLQ